MTQTRILQAYTFVLLVVRVVFLFQQKHTMVAGEITPTSPVQLENTASLQHSAAPTTGAVGSLALGETQDITTMLPVDYTQKQADTAILKQLYEQSPDPDLAQTLIGTLLDQHRFDEAYKYVEQVVSEYPDVLDPHTHIYATFHAPSLSISQIGSIKLVETTIESYRNKNLISADDYLFYQSMIQFWYNNFEAARTLLQQIESPKYQDIKNHILNNFATLSKQKDIPSYYTDAIISLALMKHGYYTIAKKIATSIVLKNNSYILPYQILAYSHFMTQNWDTAIEYLLILKDLESKQAQRYTFLVGVAQYRRGDYTQAIMYLNQVTAAGLASDAYRYIFLSYAQGGEYSRANSTRQKLLGNTEIIKNDFYSYFYTVFYVPIAQESPWTMYNSNTNLVHASVQQCFTFLDEQDHDICHYGNAGLALARGNMTQAKELLDDLIQKYDSPYLFHALGNYYTSNGESSLAEQYYHKALDTTTSEKEQAILQSKISSQ